VSEAICGQCGATVPADQIVRTLRAALAKYQDYRAALKDGFEPFHPELPQRHYHFTSLVIGR